MAGYWRYQALTALAVLLIALSVPALAAERVALVVGNAAYEQEIAVLKNPVNDATAVAAALRRLGFEVIEGVDLDEDDFYDKIGAFEDAMGSANVALFFYAGHGLQVEGRNYLAPVDLKLERKQDLRRHAIELDAVLEVMRSETNLVILDACRNNPLAAELARSLGLSRAAVASRGLARVDSASGTLIAYATEPGSVAADGTGDHSPYTAALLEHLETPSLSVQDLFTEVTASVLKRTGERQKPWTHSSLSKIVRLVPGGESETTAAVPLTAQASEPASTRLTAEQLAAERVFWVSVKDSTNPADIQAYLDRYPGGTYEVLARNRLQALQGAGAPAAPGETAKSVEERLELSRADRRLIQLGLAAEGFDPGDADGLFGRQTRGAIGRWQASQGEEATEHLDVESAKLLMASGRKRQAAAEAERLRREQEARERVQREAQERARREAEERARREAAAEAERRRRELEPGRRFRDCDACPQMVVVPAGSFMMGSPPGEEGRFDNEGPVHRVSIAEPLAVGVHEVTRGEFARFVRETSRSTGNACRVWDSNEGKVVERSGLNWRNPGFAQADRHPVVCVNWDDAQSYVRWLSRETGERYRLLSESEWEYVARAGTRTARYWGESESGQCRYGNGADASTTFDWRVSCSDGHARTSPVGSYTKNGFGLHDVLGNAWEWVQDCWNEDYAGAPGNGRAWERGDCSQRVVRGGSWVDKPRNLRSAVRYGFASGDRDYDVGFRIARTLAP